MLLYSPVWIGFLAIIVIRKWYEEFRPFDYVLLGLGVSLPCVIASVIFAGRLEKSTPLLQRYIIKANIFIGIVSYIGNHFNTHYFYNVLGVRYTGPLAPGRGWEINRVPVSMFLMTRLLHDLPRSLHSTSPSGKNLIWIFNNNSIHCYGYIRDYCSLSHCIHGDLDNKRFSLLHVSRFPRNAHRRICVLRDLLCHNISVVCTAR